MLSLSYIPDSLSYLSLDDMLDTIKELGINELEFPTGGWSSAPHFNLDRMLTDKSYRTEFSKKLSDRDMKIVALNCSGNHLAYEKDMDTVNKTYEVAELLGVNKIVMMSGLPPGCAGDKTPVWVTTCWPPDTAVTLKYQWEEVAFPAWKKLADKAKKHGIKKIALENHGTQLVYNPRTLFKLRDEIGDIIGMNLDPSHMFWMNGDPISAARELGDAIYHIHGKDARVEKAIANPQTSFETTPNEDFAERSWNYVAVGHGHDLQWWKEFFSTVKMFGYSGPVSLEMEDMTMPAMQGVITSVQALLECM